MSRNELEFQFNRINILDTQHMGLIIKYFGFILATSPTANWSGAAILLKFNLSGKTPR